MDFGLDTGFQAFSLITLLGADEHPFNMVVILHGVIGGTDSNGYIIAFNDNNGNMFFNGAIHRVGNQFHHCIPATLGRLFRGSCQGYNGSAMFTFEKSHFHHLHSQGCCSLSLWLSLYGFCFTRKPRICFPYLHNPGFVKVALRKQKTHCT